MTRTVCAAGLGLLLFACAKPPPDPLVGCRDAACLVEQGVGLWDQDPTGVIDAIDAIEDPYGRASIVEALVEHRPQTAPQLCPFLPDGISRRRCDSIAASPQLWSLDPDRPADAAASLGEQAIILAAGPTLHPPVIARGEATACDPTVPLSSCRSWRATEAAMVGDMEGAAAACGGVPTPRWQQICLVQAAQAGCRHDQTQTCGQAAELCVSAGVYRVPCLAKVATTLASTAPSSEADAVDPWFTLTSRVRELRLRLQGLDPILADRMVNRTWAEAMLLSYGTVRDVGGAPLASLPPQVLPHVRAAVAWRLATRTDGGNLAQREQALAKAVASRGTRPRTQPMFPGRLRIAQLWAQDLPGEEEISWIAYLQDSRRAWSADPVIDRRLCVLEGAARQSPVQVELLVEGLGDPQVLVRWTATRLLAAVSPRHTALAHVIKDPSPLVRQRASAT